MMSVYLSPADFVGSEREGEGLVAGLGGRDDGGESGGVVAAAPDRIRLGVRHLHRLLRRIGDLWFSPGEQKNPERKFGKTDELG